MTRVHSSLTKSVSWYKIYKLNYAVMLVTHVNNNVSLYDIIREEFGIFLEREMSNTD